MRKATRDRKLVRAMCSNVPIRGAKFLVVDKTIVEVTMLLSGARTSLVELPNGDIDRVATPSLFDTLEDAIFASVGLTQEKMEAMVHGLA